MIEDVEVKTAWINGEEVEYHFTIRDREEPCKHDAGVVTSGGFDPICLLCHEPLGS